MNAVRILSCFILSCLLVVIAGCTRQQRRGVRELQTIRKRLAAEYGIAEPVLSLDGDRALRLTLVNTRFGGLPESERRIVARAIAAVAASELRDLADLEEVVVTFQAETTPGGSLNEVGTYAYAVVDLTTPE